ncbi:MAG: pentapeptide repeat-containing protein, partial [Clostridiales bacterium]
SYLYERILNGNKDNMTNESIVALIKDLEYFSSINDPKQFIKSIIEYSDKKSNCIYKSKSSSIVGKDSELDLNLEEINQKKKIKAYIKSLKRKIRKSDWYGNYVDLKIKEVSFKLRNFKMKNDLNHADSNEMYSIDAFENMMDNSDRILLLGNPGAGKSTALLKIAWNCLENSSYFPVYIELDQYQNQPIDEFIYKFTGKKLTDDDIENWVILFDGLNELPVNSKFLENLSEVSNELSDCRIICTCRINNYKFNADEFDTYYVLPMDKVEIINFFNNEFPDNAYDIYENLDVNLRDLTSTPLLLVMLISILKYSDDSPEGIVGLFQNFTEFLLNNWETGKGDKYLAHDKFKALRELAFYMNFIKDENTCSLEEAQKIILNVLNDLEYNKAVQYKIYNEIISNGIIQQKVYSMPVEISFHHQSFMEYFASKALSERIEKYDFELFGNVLLDFEVLSFLKDMVLDIKPLEYILFDCKSKKEQKYLQTNALSLLHMKGYSFEKLNLSDCYFPEAYLRNVSFRKADLSSTIFTGADLRGANLSNTVLKDTDFSDCLLDGVSFSRCSIRSFVKIDNTDLIAYVGDMDYIKLWNIKTGETKRFGQHEKRIRKIVYNKKSELLANGSYDNSISIWNISGELVKMFEFHKDPVLAINFSENGRYLASGDSSGKVIIYDIPKDKILFNKKIHNDSIRDITFLDCTYIATASWDKSVKLFNRKTNEIKLELKDYNDYVFSVEYIKEKNIIATAGSDERLHLTKLNKNNETTILNTDFSIRSIAISIDGEYIAVAGKNGKVQIWEETKLCFEWVAHYMCTRAVSFIDENTIVTSGDDSKIKIWKIVFNKCTADCIKEIIDNDI